MSATGSTYNIDERRLYDHVTGAVNCFTSAQTMLCWYLTMTIMHTVGMYSWKCVEMCKHISNFAGTRQLIYRIWTILWTRGMRIKTSSGVLCKLFCSKSTTTVLIKISVFPVSSTWLSYNQTCACTLKLHLLIIKALCLYTLAHISKLFIQQSEFSSIELN
jgi:hypothetical protein